MSKTYFGRCAAVGIAGLTAMSSIAIVASAANQESVVYEMKYTGIGTIPMYSTVGYANGSNLYCLPITPTTDVLASAGFKVKLANLLAVTGTYTSTTTSAVGNNIGTHVKGTATAAVWQATDFTGLTSLSTGTTGEWTYTSYGDVAPVTPHAVKLEELYGARPAGTPASVGDPLVFAFKSESERSAAVSTLKRNLQNSYTTYARNAYTQFSKDVNAAKDVAMKRAAADRDAVLTDPAATAADKADAQNVYSAVSTAITNSASTIIREFSSTFTINSFKFDKAIETANCAITHPASVGGLVLSTGATYTSILGAGTPALDNSKYCSSTTTYADIDSYVFQGEIQPNGSFIAANANAFLITSGALWTPYEVINNTTSTGGNTTPSGGSTSGTTTTDTTNNITSWYPDSATYRAASEVSYLGENGSWYTSASAATIYGGGYTGTSKNSNYSSVNNSANGKAIYFDSTTGSYSTSSASYSYIVKEASTSTNTDPFYTYFFGNKNNNTTTTTAPAGSPAIKGASKYAGWTNISAFITNRAISGASYTINMNEGSVVPAAVLAAAKAKNVTLTFANDNGSKITVKPGKVSTASDLNVAVTYNVKNVKSSLVSKAKKVNPGTVSTAQVKIGSDGSLGGTATVNVKFSTKRAGCTVKAYRLSESGSLVKEATGTIASTGRVNLNLTKGGSYLLVVIDD